jgi:putative DNA primase/helicase
VFLLGRTGSGKGVLLNLLERLYPVEVRASLASFSEIDTPEHLAQHVYGRELLSWADIQGKQNKITNLYKLLDAESVLSARKLFSNDTDNFTYEGRVMCASTSPIQLDHANSGLLRRLLTIKTLDQPLASEILPQGRCNDGELERLLASELGQIVSWALAAPPSVVAQVLTKQHPLLKEAAMEVAASADSVNQFINQCLVPADGETTPEITDLHLAYQLFCRTSKMGTLRRDNFSTRLREVLPHLYKRKNIRTKDGKRGKLPARFYGFQMREGLWSTSLRLHPDSKLHPSLEDAPYIQKSPNQNENWGTLDIRKLGDGGFKELTNHTI